MFFLMKFTLLLCSDNNSENISACFTLHFLSIFCPVTFFFFFFYSCFSIFSFFPFLFSEIKPFLSLFVMAITTFLNMRVWGTLLYHNLYYLLFIIISLLFYLYGFSFLTLKSYADKSYPRFIDVICFIINFICLQSFLVFDKIFGSF